MLKKNPIQWALGLGLLYWIADAAIDAFVLKGRTFFEQVFSPGLTETLSRALPFFFIVSASVLIRSFINRDRRAKRRMKLLGALMLKVRKLHLSFALDKDIQGLINKVCDEFVLNGAYSSMWIAVLDKNNRIQTCAESGLGLDRFAPMLEEQVNNKGMECWRKTRASGHAVVMDSLSSKCGLCSFAQMCDGASVLSVCMKYGDQTMGYLLAALPDGVQINDQETALLEEVAEETAFTIHSMDLEYDHQQVGEALKKSEEQYRQLIERMNEGVWILNKNGCVNYVNDRFCEMIGYPQDEVMGSEMIRFVDPLNRADFKKIIDLEEEALKTPQEILLNRMDGEKIYVTISPAPLYDANNGYLGAFAVINDITMRRRAEQALRESEEKYRLLVENANDAIFVIQDMAIKFPNPITISMLGYSEEELASSSIEKILHPEDKALVIERHLQRLKGETPPNTYSFRIINVAGQEMWVEVNAMFINWEGKPATLNFLRDITPQKKLEAKLYQAQKMEAIGTLAGGIAHDFNNILAAIIGYTELGLYHMPKESEDRYNWEQILKAGKRAKELVQQILAFSRQTKEEKKPLEIASIVKEVLKLLRASLPSTIKIKRDIQKDTGMIMADPTQMHQVLMNLSSNAAHAMRDTSGTLKVSLKRMDLKESDGNRLGLAPASYIHLAVSDSGHGMDLETIDKIFEPYFTTKKVGEGTGMGLAVVHGIVTDLNGRITVESAPGKGSVFNLYLPRIKKSESHKAAPLGPIPGGNERILLVDDEKALIEVGQNILQRLGYQVHAEQDSVSAYLAFKQNPDSYDLIITDQTMPNMTGMELIKQIRRTHKDIPAILCTGFSDVITEQRAKAMDIQAFIMKPIITRQIAQAVRDVLDKKVSSGLDDRVYRLDQ